MKRTVKLLLSFVLIIPLFVSCSTSKPKVKPLVFQAAKRQLPPEPVYNRLRESYLPETVPERDKKFSLKRKRILPVIHLKLRRATPYEACLVLAATARYRPFCSAYIGRKRITIDALGTIDELAEKLAKKTDLIIEVDHKLREVRFLNKEVYQPVFYKNFN
ncbi:MAG: hypothetical protein D6780_05850 [Candidatus Dadabacteria bacterium]|nr:MAG: hypothetical protein D6780_05850 [Candidatus Dadabacteria bacterium]